MESAYRLGRENSGGSNEKCAQINLLSKTICDEANLW